MWSTTHDLRYTIFFLPLISLFKRKNRSLLFLYNKNYKKTNQDKGNKIEVYGTFKI